MLGIGFPDRHALPRITPIKCADLALRSPPAREGSFFGASCAFPWVLANVPSANQRRPFVAGNSIGRRSLEHLQWKAGEMLELLTI
jgi:hypothetical protein